MIVTLLVRAPCGMVFEDTKAQKVVVEAVTKMWLLLEGFGAATCLCEGH